MTALHQTALALADAAEFALWCADLRDDATAAIDDEARESTRDDGELFHGRLPSDDCDPFNPWVVARSPLAREVLS